MESVKVTAFKCKFCGKKFFVAPTCQHHELICRQNPENDHPCFKFCKHLELTTEKIYPYGREVKAYNCKKTGKRLYSNKALVNKHPVTQEEDYVKMPVAHCKFFKEISSKIYEYEINN